MKETLSKNEYAYQRLKEEITSGVFIPGEKLVVGSISKRYQVSPMPVRNAINKLQSEGFVAVTPMCGAHVHVWNYDTFCSLMQISTVLEKTASRLAAHYVTEEILEELRSICKKMESAGLSRNFQLYEQYNHSFHFLIYRQCRNDDLYEHIQELHEKTYPYTSISFHIKGRIQLSMAQHKEWLAALENHDPDASEAICSLQRVQSYSNFLTHLESCLEHLDDGEAYYYIYGFGSTFANMSVEEIKEKLSSYREAMDILRN